MGLIVAPTAIHHFPGTAWKFTIYFCISEPICCSTTLLIHPSSFAVFVFGCLHCASFSCAKAKALVHHSKSTCEHHDAQIWLLFLTSLQLKKRRILHVQMCRWSVLYVLQPQVRYGSIISKLTSKNSTYLPCIELTLLISSSPSRSMKVLRSFGILDSRNGDSQSPANQSQAFPFPKLIAVIGFFHEFLYLSYPIH